MGKTTAKVLRAIVRNDAMKEDPDEIYNWRVFALVFSSCFGGMLFGWETGAIGGVLAMDATQERYGYAHWDKKDKSLMDQNIVSTLQIGCWVSCYFTGWLADKYGRRLCLIGTGLFTIIGVVFQAASAAQGTIAVMYVGRFLAGLGVGAASTLVPLYVSECVPRAVRGGLTAFYQLFIVTGVMISFWVNYGSLLHIKGQAVFIVPLTLQVTPAVLLAICMTFQKESPRWCARKDDWESATSILSILRGYVIHTLNMASTNRTPACRPTPSTCRARFRRWLSSSRTSAGSWAMPTPRRSSRRCGRCLETASEPSSPSRS
jgi:MFS family permease